MKNAREEQQASDSPAVPRSGVPATDTGAIARTPDGQALDTLVQYCRRCGKWVALACVTSMMARTLRHARLITTAEARALGAACNCPPKRKAVNEAR
jgi:hypothetical protein